MPPPPLPEARAHQAPGLAEPAVGLQELEGALNGRAGSQEAELCELSQWFNSLSSSAKQEALASVAKTLYFPTDPSQHPPVPTLAQQLAAVAPPPSLAPPAHTGLTVYADAGLLAPAAAPAAAPTSVAAARPAPLADRTNLQGVSRAAHLKELSSKLHVAHSQKVAVVSGRAHLAEKLHCDLGAAVMRPIAPAGRFGGPGTMPRSHLKQMATHPNAQLLMPPVGHPCHPAPLPCSRCRPRMSRPCWTTSCTPRSPRALPGGGTTSRGAACRSSVAPSARAA